MLRNVVGIGMEEVIKRIIRKPADSNVYNIVAVHQLVFLFDLDNQYINIWTTFDLDNIKPGTLNLEEK